MLVLRSGMPAGRAETLRSARLPRPMEVAEVGLALLAQVVPVDAEAANVQREQLPVHQAHMALAVVVVAVLRLVSAP